MFSLKSDDDADTFSGGTGARVVRFNGLKIDGTEDFEDVEMNGQTLVPLTKAFYRIQPSGVIVAGTMGANVGNVTFENAGTVYDHIGFHTAAPNPGFGGTHSADYTVPKGYVAELAGIFFGTNDDMEILLEQDVSGVPGSPLFRRLPVNINNQDQFDVGLCYPTLADIGLLAASASGQGNLTANMGFTLMKSVDGKCPS